VSVSQPQPCMKVNNCFWLTVEVVFVIMTSILMEANSFAQSTKLQRIAECNEYGS